MNAWCKINGYDDIEGSWSESQVESEYIYRAIYVSLALLSIIGLAIVALSIFYDRRLSDHPSPLIAQICVIEAVLCFNSLIKFLEPQYVVCYFRLYLTLGKTTWISYNKATLILIWANQVINNVAQLVSLSLNMSLCVDLVLTLLSPFDVARNRMAYYETVSFLFGVGFGILIWNYQDKYSFMRGDIDTEGNSRFSDLTLALSLSVYILVAVYSMIFSERRLKKPGVSEDVRRRFQNKHTTYVLMFIFIWTI